MSLYPYPVVIAPPPAGLSPAPDGVWLDCLTPGSLWQDTARTTPASNGNAVASWFDPATARAATMSTSSPRPVISNGAPVFDGLDDRLELPELLNTSAVTIVAVVRPGSVAALAALFWDYGNTNQTIFLAINAGGAPWFRVRDMSSNVIDAIHPATLSANVTAVVAGRINGTTGTVWRGLTPHAVSNAAYQSTVWTNTEVGPPTIGSFPGGGSTLLSGAIRSLAIWRSALSDAQVESAISFLATRHGVTL